MARLIDANELLAELKEELEYETPMFTAEQNKWIDYGLRVAIKDLKYQSTVDAVEVVHGRWCKDGDWLVCLNCESEINVKNSLGVENRKNYCPNCGADMRERKDNV